VDGGVRREAFENETSADRLTVHGGFVRPVPSVAIKRAVRVVVFASMGGLKVDRGVPDLVEGETVEPVELAAHHGAFGLA
jgi:hypothetical protein